MQSVKPNYQIRPKTILLGSIVATVLFHFIGLTQHIKLNVSYLNSTPEKKEQKIKLKFVNNQSHKNKFKTRQIIETKLSNLKRKTKDSKFLSDKNRAVDRESVAKSIGKFKEAGQGLKHGSITKQATKSKNKGKEVKRVSLADLAMDRAKLIDEVLKENKVSSSKPTARLGLKSGNKKKSGLSKRNDYIKDLPLGDFTKMNTVQYKYYGFFHRIKKKLEVHWGQNIQSVAKNIFKKGRRLPANKHYITSLIIQMNEFGKIIKINVDSTSGVLDLDGAAVTSFNNAGPFKNPPRGLLKNGVATINWKFAVDAN